MPKGKKVVFNDGDFKTSSFTSKTHSWCVQVAHKDGTVAVRDSKDSEKKTLYFNANEWKAFVSGAKNGEFDF